LDHRCCWWWYLLTIQKSFALFQIVFGSTIDLAPLLCIDRAMERYLLLLIIRLLLAISTISTISVISKIGCVDLPIVLLFLWGPLVTWFKESSSGLENINAYVSNYEQISHCLGLLHCDLLNSLLNMSLTLSPKALMISMSMIYGIAFLALQKCFT
jgi:hypothetical protein